MKVITGNNQSFDDLDNVGRGHARFYKTAQKQI